MMFTLAVFFRAGAPLARELVSEPPGPESRLCRARRKFVGGWNLWGARLLDLAVGCRAEIIAE